MRTSEGCHISHVLRALTELQKLGPTRGTLYIQLANSTEHYLVLVITDTEFRYALILTKVHTDSMYAEMTMEDIGWLDAQRIHGEEAVIKTRTGLDGAKRAGVLGQKRKHSEMETDITGASSGLGEIRASDRYAV